MGADADGYGDGFSYDPNYEYGESSANVEDGYGDGGEGEYQDRAGDEDIKQEDYWTVITSFFDGMGLVRQQLESFNEFIDNTMQEIVDENSRLALDQYNQHTGRSGDETVSQRGFRGFGFVLAVQRHRRAVSQEIAASYRRARADVRSGGMKYRLDKSTSPEPQ